MRTISKNLPFVESFNLTDAEYPVDLTIYELFEAQVSKNPGKTALVQDERSITYRDLNLKANHFAKILREKQVKPDEVTGILMEQSIEFVIAFLAVLKAGGAYLPVDPDYPKDRISYILENSGSKLLITKSSEKNKIKEFKGEIILLDDYQNLEAEENNLEKVNKPSDLVYVIYTSGSTGRPKGVMVTHQGLVNYITWADKVYLEGEKLDFPLYTSVSFDLTVTSIFTPLVTGNTIFIYAGGDKISLIERLVKDNKTGIVKLTPTHLSMIEEMDCKGSKIRKFIVGGEDLKSSLAHKIRSKFNGQVRIFNEYGPTETVVGCMIHEFDPAKDTRPSVPIGKPGDNVRIYLLNGDMKPVPDGNTGEIYVSGDGVARGYLNNPELTEEKFIADSFLPGKIMYRTGDLARFISSGEIEFLGRADFQVKIRGFLIEPGEIESVMSRFKGINETVVIAREDFPGNQVLAAYYTSPDSAKPDQNEIRRFLKERLPEYMIPSVFTRMEKLPLTSNNKIDRKALPAPQADQSGAGKDYSAPSTQTEIRIAELWSELLKIADPGIHSNFFELGGHSLTAALLILRIRREFGVDVPFRLIFENPTIGGLGEFVDTRVPSGIRERKVKSAIPAAKLKSDEYPLSSIQNRIWFMENFDKNTTAYNIPLDYKITGALDIDLLGKSINLLVSRHESLRTIFTKVNGFPVQKVLPKMLYNLEVVNLEKEPADRLRETISMHSFTNAVYKFDLEKGPLFRFELLVLGSNEYILLVNFHHIISDAASEQIFFTELTTVYGSFISGKKAILPPITVSYADYSVWQKKWNESEECRRQLDYWKTELAGIPEALHLPTDFHRPKIQTYNGTEYHFEIDQPLRKRIFALSRKHGASLSVPLMAAYGVLLSKYSSQDDLVMGVPISTRTMDQQESTIGALINTLPLRFIANEGMTFAEALEQVKKKFFPALENQDVPFEKLVEELKIKRAMDTSPVYQVLFNFLSHYREDIELERLTFHMIEGERKSAQFDLNLIVNDLQDKINCTFEYNTDLYKKETIERFAGHWLALLDTVCSREDLPVDEISVLTEKEKKAVLSDWNMTSSAYPENKCIHHLFEEQVTSTPSEIAVEYEHDKLTYQELNTKANRMAAYLAGQGARGGRIVAVFLERSIDLAAALLAVSKTGATYLPLDPIYPKGRLEMILEDAKPVLILTQSSLLEKLPAASSGIILADDKNMLTGKDDFSAGPGNPENPAYVLYTSGSTGKPKGVAIRQKSVVNLVNSFSRLLDVKPEDTLLAVTTISFDIAELEFFLPLFNGARLVIASQETALNAELLMQKLEECNATIFQATPVTFRMLVSSSWKGKPDLKVLCGGEAFPKELARELTTRCAETWNVYGPTETTIWSVAKKVTPQDTEGDGYVPIGRPLDNTTLYVLNKKNVPVPPGLPGELYIGGDGISPGYLNLPEMTAEKFIPDIFSNDPASKLYRTGDLVKYLPDGNLVFLERADSQVKIRGFRIELGEIESVFSRNGQIKENVVVVREDESGEKMLVAYYISGDDAAPGHQELRQFLSELLPDYMIPSIFVRMEKFPLTANNKVDRKALPEPQFTKTQSSREYAAPRTPTEQKLASIWAALLKLEKVGIRDNFFDIGGHSMIAVSLMLRIEKEIGIRLSLGNLFEYSTIIRLAELIDDTSKLQNGGSPVHLQPAGAEPSSLNGGKKNIFKKLFKNQ